MVLFGSRATGEYTQHSDFDLAVVSSTSAGEPRMYRRATVVLAALGDVRGIDPVGLAPAELEALDGLLVLDVVADGTPLVDDGCVARARARLVELQRDGSLQRLRGGWRTPAARDG
ncbi:MAG: nucleotidyltransferase domain-containing protein [Deltaproteobacteria bacterium]|nr:nucleotidyltransferase domain-containing protein [Deltaproteobacteria bacterium]